MTRAIVLTIAGLIAVAGGTGRAHAQAVGDRVRITRTRSLVLVKSRLYEDTVAATSAGVLVRASADTLVLAADHGGDTLLVSTKWITAVEVSRGTQSGAAMGAIVGVIGGAVVGVVACRSARGCYHSSLGEGADFTTPVMLIGAGLGLVTGLAIGASSSGEHWEPVPQDRWHFSLAPQAHGRVGLGLSLAF